MVVSDTFMCCPAIPTPTPGLECVITHQCLGIECCADIDLKVIQRSVYVNMVLDSCNFEISITFGKWFFNTTLFTYEWGKNEVMMLGNAIYIRFSIDKLDSSKEFSLNFAFQLDLNGDITDFNIVSDLRIPIPVCNENSVFILPGDGSIEGFIRGLGANVSQVAVDVVLKQLGIYEYLTQQECAVPQSSIPTECSFGFQLPAVDNILQCHVQDECLGIQCCVEIDLKITHLMLKTWLILDPCNFALSVRFGEMYFNQTLFTYKWGEIGHLRVSDSVLIRFSVDKIDQDQDFSITLGIEVCINSVCDVTPVFDDIRIPIPLCNIDFNNLVLPGDGTIQGFVQELGETIGDSAVGVVLNKLGLADFVSNVDCREGGLIAIGNDCPSITLPTPDDLLTCQPIQYCTGIQCCASLEIKVTKLYLDAWLALDPCNFQLSVGLGSWRSTHTITSGDWGVERDVAIRGTLRLRYTIDKIDAQESFQLDLHVDINIDNNWETTSVLTQWLIPIPFCNTDGTLALPGGSIDDFINQLAGGITDAAINEVLKALGIK
ncbi:uncharacterized protein, partial [Amphiura filiformis]|uniref:uncharacterized protein n=1 Tax=Amphiura filiformis TaxID=82378 RepID=UPI003B213A43